MEEYIQNGQLTKEQVADEIDWYIDCMSNYEMIELLQAIDFDADFVIERSCNPDRMKKRLTEITRLMRKKKPAN